MPQRTSIVKTFGAGLTILPLCIGSTVIFEAYGTNAVCQTCIPLSAVCGSTATGVAPTLLYGGGSYSRSVLTVATGTATAVNFYYSVSSNSWANTASNSAPSSSSQGVYAASGYSRSSYPAGQIGQVIYPGGYNGARYWSDSISACPYCIPRYVWGGLGGQAGTNGPGGNGSSAYPTGSTATTVGSGYNSGAGGAANGGTSACRGVAGQSRWNTAFGGGGGSGGVGNTSSFNFGNRDYVVFCSSNPSIIFGPLGGTSGYGSNGVFQSGGPTTVCSSAVIVTYTQGETAIPTGTYRYIFTASGVYNMYVPVGTTSTTVEVLGAGANGNTSAGLNTTLGNSAGGAGGGYALSTLTQTFTVSTIMTVTVASVGGCYSNAVINGVTQAQAWSAIDYRGGGTVTGRTNSAVTGFTRNGGAGGYGYSSGSLTRRGGGGGGAAWRGGAGGAGGYTVASNCTASYRAGGGGAASTSAAGGAAVSASTTTWGGGGGLGGGVAGTGGSVTATGASPRTGGAGRCGGGGGAGPTVTGTSPTTSRGGVGSQYTVYTSSVNAGIISVGPGGGGGGSMSNSTTGGTGGAAGGYGAGGGGGCVAGAGTGGLAIVTFAVCGNIGSTSSVFKTGVAASHYYIIN